MAGPAPARGSAAATALGVTHKPRRHEPPTRRPTDIGRPGPNQRRRYRGRRGPAAPDTGHRALREVARRGAAAARAPSIEPGKGGHNLGRVPVGRLPVDTEDTETSVPPVEPRSPRRAATPPVATPGAVAARHPCSARARLPPRPMEVAHQTRAATTDEGRRRPVHSGRPRQEPVMGARRRLEPHGRAASIKRGARESARLGEPAPARRATVAHRPGT